MLKMSDYLRVSEAAAYLGIKVRTLRDWKFNGKIRSFKHPNMNRCLYMKSDLDAILNGIKAVSGNNLTEEVESALEFCDPENKLNFREDLPE